MNTIRNSLKHIYTSIFVLSVSFFAVPCIANANPDILDKIQADITQEQKASIIAIEELKEACLNYAYVPCTNLSDKVKFLAWKTVAGSYDEYKEKCSLPKLDIKTGHYIASTSHILENQILGLRAAYIRMRVYATETSTSLPICYNTKTIVAFAGPLANDISSVINASPDYIALKRGETEVQKNIQQQKLAEDRAEQEKMAAELEQMRIREAEKKRRQEEIYREEQRIRAENETQKAKDNMRLLSQEIHNELKSNLNNSKVDGVDIKNVCICKCLSNNKIRQLVNKFISEFSFVNDGSRPAHVSLPYDLEMRHCTGFGAAMEYKEYIKAFDKHRISGEPHMVVCDNICSDVVKDQPKKQSLNDFFGK